MPRHGTENLFNNSEEIYEEFLEKRDRPFIRQYRTPRLPRLTEQVRTQFNSAVLVWKADDHYWKLAARYYGDSKLWWIIGWFNEKPTEGHLKIGDIVLIPQPIDKLLSFFNYGTM